MASSKTITVEVGDVSYTHDVEPRLLLVQYLRDRLGKTGTLTEYACDPAVTTAWACTTRNPTPTAGVELGKALADHVGDRLAIKAAGDLGRDGFHGEAHLAHRERTLRRLKF